ncbi:MAG: fibronectin type III domain-containing protein [Saprospiraceae bacterium]|nr:fibronectin type III domain-containing protein [Saprospiraceae bacterium]
MKAHHLFLALGLVTALAACEKEQPLLPLAMSDDFAPPPAERCGCLPPFALQVRSIASTTAEIAWNTMPEAIQYRVEWSGDHAIAPTVATTEDNQTTLTGLVPGVSYRFRVTSICGSVESEASAPTSFETSKYGIGPVREHTLQTHSSLVAEE